MNQLSASPAMSARAQKLAANDNRLNGRLLVLARSIWTTLVLFTLGLLAFNLPRIPHLLAQAQAPCSNAQCTTGFLSPDALHTLHTLGVTASAFAIFYSVIFFLIPLVVWVAAGLFLAWRRSDDWMALLVSLFFILFQSSIALAGLVPDSLSLGSSQQSGPLWFVLFYSFCQSLAFPVFALFPNGRFAPRWSVWPTIAVVGFQFLFFVPPQSLLGMLTFPIGLLLVMCLAGSMIYRYRRRASALEQQQIKWLVFTLVFDILVNWIGPVVLSLLFPQFGPSSLAGALYNLIWPVTFLGIPLSVGIAILRYRLWDIDSIINRTLVYGLLSGILVTLYVGLIISLESLVGLLTRQTSQPVVLVISTLVIYVLFTPLRHRIQEVIDRRFYREKYDAEQTLATFGATLRNEVDLKQLSEQVVTVVQETMHPTFVSLWLVKQQKQTMAFSLQPSSSGDGPFIVSPASL